MWGLVGLPSQYGDVTLRDDLIIDTNPNSGLVVDTDVKTEARAPRNRIIVIEDHSWEQAAQLVMTPIPLQPKQ